MVDYLVFPFIALIVALKTIHHVRVRTGSPGAAALAGGAGFIFCFWVRGMLLYGCVLAGLLMVSAISSERSQSPS